MNTNKWKLEFSETDVEISNITENPFDNQIKESPLDSMNFDILKEKFENNYINMNVTKIDRKIENDILKSLIFYVSDFKFLQYSDIPSQKINTDDNEGQRILLFGEEKKTWRDYNDLLKITSKWLFENKRLQKKDLPVYVPHGKQYLIHSIPVHEYGKKFAGKPYKISENIFLNTNFSSDSCLTHSEYLMKKFAPEIDFKILGFQ